jgi:hypothetical protein
LNGPCKDGILQGKGIGFTVKPFTCLMKKEGNQYASLCVELDIASCGKKKHWKA